MFIKASAVDKKYWNVYERKLLNGMFDQFPPMENFHKVQKQYQNFTKFMPRAVFDILVSFYFVIKASRNLNFSAYIWKWRKNICQRNFFWKYEKAKMDFRASSVIQAFEREIFGNFSR